MSKPISITEEISGLSIRLVQNREEVEDDIKTKMGNAEIFTQPKDFEKL